MKKFSLMVVVLTLIAVLPMELFIMYTILKTIEVDRLIWFLFVIKIPFVILMQIFMELARAEQ